MKVSFDKLAIYLGVRLLSEFSRTFKKYFYAFKRKSKAINADLSWGMGGGAKTIAALTFSTRVFGPLLNQYRLKRATTAIKVLKSVGNVLLEI